MCEVSTFGKWAVDLLGRTEILDHGDTARLLRPHLAGFPASESFLVEEIEYLTGRFEPGKLDTYLTAKRGGRGASPRVDQALRRRLLDEVIAPCTATKGRIGAMDWNDIAVAAKDVTSVPLFFPGGPQVEVVLQQLPDHLPPALVEEVFQLAGRGAAAAGPASPAASAANMAFETANGSSGGTVAYAAMRVLTSRPCRCGRAWPCSRIAGCGASAGPRRRRGRAWGRSTGRCRARR